MEEEIKLSKDGIQAFFNEHMLGLCAFARDLSANNLCLIFLHAELSEFHLKVAEMVRGESDPNLLLQAMVSTSIAKRGCLTLARFEESRKLDEEIVQKMTDFERSGCRISTSTKYEVLRHQALYYVLKGQLKKSYEALLELETLPVDKERNLELQLLIARGEGFVSADNFEGPLKRYEKALQLAKEIYPIDHPKLVMTLQHMTMFLYNKDKIQEAKPYAEELMVIAKKCPFHSWQHVWGMTSALSVLKEFDAPGSAEMLFAMLDEGWPQIYKRVIDGWMEPSSEVIEDHSDVYVAPVLEGLLECFIVISNSLDNKHAQQNFGNEKGILYLRIAEILLAIFKQFYDEKDPGLKPEYSYLIRVHSFLGNTEQVTKFTTLLNQCEQEAPFQLYQNVPGDCFSKLKEQANNFYLSGNYDDALSIYTELLNPSPNDAKLLTNRSATFMKLSQQCENSSSAQFAIIKSALKDSENAITADPSWVKGYYWKAVSLAHLGERGPSLAAAAVAQHLFPSQCAKVPAVEDRFGSCNAQVVTTAQELLQATEKRDTRNLVIVVKEGRYELPNPVKLQDDTVMVGLGETLITCSQGIPLKVNKTVYMENLTLSPSI